MKTIQSRQIARRGLRVQRLGIAVLYLLLTGCVVSLNPLYHDRDLVSDERLLGTWVDEDGSTWQFDPTEGGHYELTYLSERAEPRTLGRHPAPLEARLIELGEYRFLDLTVDPKADENSLFDLHLLPTHSIWRILVADKTISLESLDPEWIEAAGAAFVEVNGWKVLTGTTDELQALVTAAVDSEEALEEPGILRRAIPQPSIVE